MKTEKYFGLLIAVFLSIGAVVLCGGPKIVLPI
jgi:hypothetical protein